MNCSAAQASGDVFFPSSQVSRTESSIYSNVQKGWREPKQTKHSYIANIRNKWASKVPSRVDLQRYLRGSAKPSRNAAKLANMLFGDIPELNCIEWIECIRLARLPQRYGGYVTLVRLVEFQIRREVDEGKTNWIYRITMLETPHVCHSEQAQRWHTRRADLS